MTQGGPRTPDLGKPGTPAIDRSVLGEWLAGDAAAIDELLAVFRDSIRAEQTKMRETLALGDLNDYASATHRLRGAALSMGARGLAETAGTLYAAARAGDAAGCAREMAALDTDIGRMVAEVPGGSGSKGG